VRPSADSGSDVVAAAAIAPVSGLVSALRTRAERSTPSRSVPGGVALRDQSRHQAMVPSSSASSAWAGDGRGGSAESMANGGTSRSSRRTRSPAATVKREASAWSPRGSAPASHATSSASSPACA
jgi:hypothetical protein